ncbi:MAG TPA: GDP-L-fucose synthase [Candidatus Acidoferrales bacterium]
MSVDKNTRIYVAGHRGLAGSAIVRALRAAGYDNLLLRTSAEVDLTEQAKVRQLFETEQPEYVFDAAAKVGGINANNTLPAEFIRINLAIQGNLIHEAWRAGVKRLLFLGSNCIYPRDCPQPIKEDFLLTGPLELTNRPYAIAKIAGLEMCWAYNRQYGTRFGAPMPTNMYGPNDSYDPEHSHVISAFIRKFYEAKKTGAKSVIAWGSGTPRREFLHSDDMAAACLQLANLPDADWDALFPLARAPIVNLGTGTDQTIAELAETVRRALGATARIEWDRTKPDGTPRKLCDSTRMLATGWRPKIDLEAGIRALIPELDKRFGA